MKNDKSIELEETTESSHESTVSADLTSITRQVTEINQQLDKLNSHKLIRTYDSIPRLLWFHLLKGIALGLGSVFGATVVLSFFVYVLSQMEFIPIIGEWVTAILEIVQEAPKQ